MTRSIFRAVLGGVLLTLVSVAPSGAQETAAAGCSSGWASFGALGISSFSCDCTVTYRETDDISWIFRGEPTVTGIAEDGPASGKLRRGDVIVAIDGLLITTRAAGEKVASLKEGQAVALTVRRNGRVLEVQIRASDDCTTPGLVPAIASAPAAAPARPGAMTPLPTAPIRPPRLSGTTVPSIAAAPAAIPAIPPAPENPLTAWFGFGISCHNCRVRPGGIWEFSEYPTLYSVDPDSPAEKAGLRRGDVLMKIDGADLLTADGVRRFGNIDPGQTVTWSFRRGGASRSVRVTAAERPGSADLGEFRSLV
ncbi:MAG: PDZ domain-containing protein, partial [Gemmatimonadota bacterium]